MSRRTIHVCQSIRGALMNWRDRDWVGVCRDAAGRMMSPNEVKAAFLDEMANGHEVIPIGPACEGFDYKTGCPGHDVSEEEQSS
jgi:hypothetical protein